VADRGSDCGSRSGWLVPPGTGCPKTRAAMWTWDSQEDVADLIVYVASLPAHVVINEVMITPTWNRAYVDQVQRAGL
jgi:hypothetical protein